jgi:hypothetical protein
MVTAEANPSRFNTGWLHTFASSSIEGPVRGFAL